MPHEAIRRRRNLDGPESCTTASTRSDWRLPCAIPAIPRRYSHFVFGVIQSGLTCVVTASIASMPFLSDGTFLVHAGRAWLLAWAVMLPVVLVAAPLIHRLVYYVTR